MTTQHLEHICLRVQLLLWDITSGKPRSCRAHDALTNNSFNAPVKEKRNVKLAIFLQMCIRLNIASKEAKWCEVNLAFQRTNIWKFLNYLQCFATLKTWDTHVYANRILPWEQCSEQPWLSHRVLPLCHEAAGRVVKKSPQTILIQNI